MTKFNPDNKDVLTYDDILSPAMKITDQDDADQYFADYVAYIKKAQEDNPQDGPYASPEETAKINLGYFAGYWGNDTRERVERLFKCSHPVFGSIANGSPTPEEAFKKGQELASRDTQHREGADE